MADYTISDIDLYQRYAELRRKDQTGRISDDESSELAIFRRAYSQDIENALEYLNKNADEYQLRVGVEQVGYMGPRRPGVYHIDFANSEGDVFGDTHVVDAFRSPGLRMTVPPLDRQQKERDIRVIEETWQAYPEAEDPPEFGTIGRHWRPRASGDKRPAGGVNIEMR